MAKELSLMGQLRKEADRDFSKYLKYVNEIFEENKKLKEKVRFLEECLDRKEKVNKSLREDIDKLQKIIWELEG